MNTAQRNGETRAALPLDAAEVAKTLRRPEQASMLPPAAFTDASVFEWELANLFSGWICVGHASQVAEQGSFLTREIGPESVLVVGGEDGKARAFHNVCRHRGARLVSEPDGTVNRRLQCPYHAWSYGLDGSLQASPHMDGIEDFDRSCFGLSPARLAVVGGLLLVNLAGDAPDPTAHVGEFEERLEHYRNGELRSGGRVDYTVDANWKVIAENYSECLHCPGVHPELNALSHYLSGDELRGEGAWCGGWMTLTAEGASTMGSGGGHASRRPPIEGIGSEELNTIYYVVLFPNALISLHPDYVMLHTLFPRAPDRTDVICEWFFEPRAIEAADFDPSDAIEFWDTTNRQDWHVCELAQKGVGSRGYSAGRYSLQETDVHEFDKMVAERYMEAIGDRGAVPA